MLIKLVGLLVQCIKFRTYAYNVRLAGKNILGFSLH